MKHRSPSRRRSASKSTWRLANSSEEEATPPGPLDVDLAEAARAEHEPQLALGVVEDRAVVDPLVPDLPDRSLEPRPLGEAADDRAAGRSEVVHAPREALGVR